MGKITHKLISLLVIIVLIVMMVVVGNINGYDTNNKWLKADVKMEQGKIVIRLEDGRIIEYNDMIQID